MHNCIKTYDKKKMAGTVPLNTYSYRVFNFAQFNIKRNNLQPKGEGTKMDIA